MKGVIFIFIGLLGFSCAQFLNNRPFPTYSLENMPETEFSCRDKILGGYYADVETMCQMFHICVKVAGVGIQDFRFLCPNGTAFDQDHQICAEWEDVDCDASTLYYSSDNFDLYRIGSGFESKAVKYGEDEETFALQRAETGDARVNREHQAQRVNQQKEQAQFRKNKQNNDKEIFKGSSSSNFFNNRNGGKETDDDYDDNINANQNNDNLQKKKLLRKQQRRPVQNENNQQNRRPVQQQNNFQNGNRQQQNNRPQQNQNNRQQQQPTQNNNQRQQNQNNRPQQQPTQNNNNNDYRQQQNQNNRPQQQPVQNNNNNNDYRQQQNQNNRPQQQPAQNNNNNNNDYRQQQNQNNRPQQQPAQNNNNNDYRQQQNQNNRQQLQQQPVQNNNNNNDYRQHQNQQLQPVQNNNNKDYRQQQNENSRPQPQQFVEAQTYRPNRPTGFANNFAGSSYVPTTSRPITTTIAETNKPRNGQRQYNNAENFRQNQNSASPNYPLSTPAPFKQTQQYNSPPNRQTTQNNKQYHSTTQVPQRETENYPTNFPKQNYNKPTENYPQRFSQSQAPIRNNNNQFNNNNYNSNYDVPKVKPTENYSRSKQTENYSTQAPINRNNQFTTPVPKVTQYNTHYDIPKVKPTKQNDNYQTTAFKNDYSTQFNKKPTTPFKQTDNYPTTFAPKFNKAPNNNFPSTFAPRTNSGYTQISQQTTNYNTQNNFNNQQQYSTPRSTPFTQYTPTVPKITSTTPVARSNRFDETQYDDGSYNPKYDRNNDDEFLKTAHSQNIASSRNEFSKSTKNVQQSTQKPQYESPRPFSVSPNTPKATDFPKSTQKPIENKKKVKDVSYDYAYYDTNVGSEPEYEIDTEIKKSNVKN